MNNSIKTLKDILKSQKTAIENKGGKVIVNNLNVSPSEITEGINSIPVPDFTVASASTSDVIEGKTFYAQDSNLKTGTFKKTDFTIATATENDVIAGKTFYSKDNNLKTGTFTNYTDFTLANATENDVLAGKTFYALDNTLKTGNYSPVMSEDTFFEVLLKPKAEEASHTHTLTFPEKYNAVRTYLFYNITTQCELYFPDSIKTIEEYAFYNCSNMTFPNFPTCKIEIVKDAGMRGSRMCYFDNLPASLKRTGEYSFANCANYNIGIRLLNGVEYALGTFASTDSFPLLDFFDLGDYKGDLGIYWLQGINFKCDFVAPNFVRSIGHYFNFNGSFENIYIHSGISNFGNYCFGTSSSYDGAYSRLKTITIDRQEPPQAQSNIFPRNNNYVIYVPDESLDAYKTRYGYTQYAHLIKPMSEKQ